MYTNCVNDVFLAGYHGPDNEISLMAYFTVAEDRCLNYNYKKTRCRRCRDICPRQCWDDNGTPLPERCDACGLCQAACPTDAIAVEGQPAEVWAALLKSDAEELHLSCRKHGAGPWSCLGFLNARDLVALSWRYPDKSPQTIFVHTLHCNSCREEVGRHLAEEIGQARQFLATWKQNTIREDGEAPKDPRDEKRIGRRGFFSALLSTGVETAQNVLWPEQGVRPIEKSRWRSQLLRDRTAPELLKEQNVFPVLSIDDSCIACGLCAKICPIQAMTAHETPVALTLSHQPLVCTDCGLCLEHCPTDSIRRQIGGMSEAKQLISKEFPHCNECGESFKPAGQQLTCFDCLLKGRRSVFGPETTD